METMNYAALLPSRKVDWRATKDKGRAFALPLAALRGYPRAFTAWSHPLASPALNSRTGAPRLATGLPHGSTQTIEGLARAANATLILTLIAGRYWNGRMRHVPCSIYTQCCGKTAGAAVPIGDRGETTASRQVPQ